MRACVRVVLVQVGYVGLRRMCSQHDKTQRPARILTCTALHLHSTPGRGRLQCTASLQPAYMHTHADAAEPGWRTQRSGAHVQQVKDIVEKCRVRAVCQKVLGPQAG